MDSTINMTINEINRRLKSPNQSPMSISNKFFLFKKKKTTITMFLSIATKKMLPCTLSMDIRS